MIFLNTSFIKDLLGDNPAMWLVLVIMISGLVVLILGGDFLVKGASNIAYSLHISPMVVGLTIVAFGTSAPELLISTISALDGKSGIALGNVIGSNICNLTLVLGVTAVFYPIVVSKDSIKIDWLVTMGASIMLFVFLIFGGPSEEIINGKSVVIYGSLNIVEGIIFVCCIIAYTYFLIQKSRRETKEKIKAGLSEGEEFPEAKGGVAKELLFILFGCAGLFLGARYFVGSVEYIGIEFGISEEVIGLTVVALGTSLPELVTSAIAAFKKNTDLAIGNLLGSSIFNILSILGITSIIQRIDVKDQRLMQNDIFWMIGITLVLLPMMITRSRVGRFEGFLLLVIYSVYIFFLAQSAL